MSIERTRQQWSSHGMNKTRFYRIWEGIKQRCYNPNSTAYKNYGARGIQLCGEWHDFKRFMDDMYDSYIEHVKKHGEDDTQIDRNDNEKDYCLENCSWVTRVENANNKRKRFDRKFFKVLFPDGTVKVFDNQRQFCIEYNMNKSHVNQCLKGKRETHNKCIFVYIDADEYIELRDRLPPVEEQPKLYTQEELDKACLETKQYWKDKMEQSKKSFRGKINKLEMQLKTAENIFKQRHKNEIDNAVEEAGHKGYKNGYGIGHKDGYERAIEILQLQNH